MFRDRISESDAEARDVARVALRLVDALQPVARFEPAGKGKKPWTILVWGAPLKDTLGRKRRFASREAAIKAGRRG
jgi:hypothetical protein